MGWMPAPTSWFHGVAEAVFNAVWMSALFGLPVFFAALAFAGWWPAWGALGAVVGGRVVFDLWFHERHVRAGQQARRWAWIVHAPVAAAVVRGAILFGFAIAAVNVVADERASDETYFNLIVLAWLASLAFTAGHVAWDLRGGRRPLTAERARRRIVVIGVGCAVATVVIAVVWAWPVSRVLWNLAILTGLLVATYSSLGQLASEGDEPPASGDDQGRVAAP